jgi:site-specific DNA recombinase
MTPTRVLLYDRFSPRPSEPDLPARIAGLRDWAAHQPDWPEIPDSLVFTDKGLSGDDWRRPGLVACLRHVRRGSVVLCRSFDRLARDSYLFAYIRYEIEQAGGKVVAVENGEIDPHNPMSQLLADILGAIAAFQKQMIGQRTRSVMQRKIRAGVYKGRVPPVGYRWRDQVVGLIEPIPEEAGAIERILQLAELYGGTAPFVRITTQLAAEGLARADGTPWDWNRVRKVVEASRPKRRRKVSGPNGNGHP